MIKNSSSLRYESIESMRGGKGTVQITHLMEKDRFHNKGRLFAHIVLKPGVSIGYHKHEGEFEGFYFLKGEGIYTENDTSTVVKAGDFTLVDVNGSHGIENNSTENLEMVALILFD